MRTGKVSETLVRKWKSFKAADKKPYENEEDADLVRVFLATADSPTVKASPKKSNTSKKKKKAGMTTKDSTTPVKKTTKAKASAAGKAPKKKKDPNAPKRPASAWIRYCTDSRPGLKEQNPDLTFGDVAKLLSAGWKSLTGEQRLEFGKGINAELAQYKVDTAAYELKKAAANAK